MTVADSGNLRIKTLYRIVDERAGIRRPPLLSVSIHLGVVRRDSITDDLPRAEDLSSYKVCEPGDIVLNRMRAFQGAIGISHERGLVSPDYVVLRPAPAVEGRYLHHLFRSTWFVGEMISRLRGIGSTEQGNVRTPRINPEDLGEIRINLPAFEEQRRIADFLDAETARIDRICISRKEQTQLLQERMLSRWSNLIGASGRDGEWLPIRRFIQSITDGPFGSSLTSGHYSAAGARVIRLGNIGRAVFKGADEAFIPLGYFRELRRHEARSGDLVVAGLGDEHHPLGRACVVPDEIGPAIVKADCFRLRLDQSRLTHVYAAWALSSPVVAEQVVMLARGSTRARINLSVVREIKVPVPSTRTQLIISGELAEFRSGITLVIAQCKRQLDLLAERRQALITAAVTGRFDVSTAA